MYDSIDQLFREQKWEDAAFAVQARLQIYPTDARLHAYLGLALFRLGKFDEACPSFFRAYTLDPNFGDAAVKHAQCLERQRRYREAMDVVKEWLPRRPNDAALVGLHDFLKQKWEAEEHDGWERSIRLDASRIE